jgi:hypothetical protein
VCAPQQVVNGIYFLANDFASDWVHVATESIRAKGCTLPICIIAFDAQTRQLERMAARYKFEIWHDPLIDRLETIGAQFYPKHPVNRRMFRRLASFWGPYDHFIFTDVDMVALMNWDEILDAFMASGSRFWYFDRSPNDVYRPGPLLDELKNRGRAVLFNGGMFASARNVMTFEKMQALTPQALALRAELYDSGEQPFFNYYMDYYDVPLDSADTFMPDLYDWMWAPSTFDGRTDFFEIADRTGSFNGKRFPMIHWAGHDPGPYMPQRALYLKYRFRNASLGDRLRYNWTWQKKRFSGKPKRRLQT